MLAGAAPLSCGASADSMWTSPQPDRCDGRELGGTSSAAEVASCTAAEED